jgi:hypothetical protein
VKQPPHLQCLLPQCFFWLLVILLLGHVAPAVGNLSYRNVVAWPISARRQRPSAELPLLREIQRGARQPNSRGRLSLN